MSGAGDGGQSGEGSEQPLALRGVSWSLGGRGVWGGWKGRKGARVMCVHCLAVISFFLHLYGFLGLVAGGLVGVGMGIH